MIDYVYTITQSPYSHDVVYISDRWELTPVWRPYRWSLGPYHDGVCRSSANLTTVVI